MMNVTYLRVDTDGLVAFLAAVGEGALVAFDAVRVLITEHITLPRKRLVALPAAEMSAMPVLVHRLGVFATENKLKNKINQSQVDAIDLTLYENRTSTIRNSSSGPVYRCLPLNTFI